MGRVFGNFETWKSETKDLGTSSMGRGDEWGGNAGRQIQGRRDVNDRPLALRGHVTNASFKQ